MVIPPAHTGRSRSPRRFAPIQIVVLVVFAAVAAWLFLGRSPAPVSAPPSAEQLQGAQELAEQMARDQAAADKAKPPPKEPDPATVVPGSGRLAQPG